MDYASVVKIIVLFSGWILYLSYFKQEQQRKTFGNGSSKGMVRIFPKFFSVEFGGILYVL